MLTNWNETSTWNSMNGGVSTDDVEARSAIDVTFVPNTSVPFTLNLTSTGITATVQAWVNGTAANQGWLFLNSGADNYIFNSSDDVAVNRPALLVSFTAPEPAI